MTSSSKMTSLSVKVLAAAIGMIVLVPSLAEAAKARKHRKPAVVQTSQTIGAVRYRGTNLFMAGPIFWGNDYLGDDPDPFIRSQIARDGVRYGGPD